MANKFVSFLETVGKDIEHGIEKIAPFATAAAATIVPAIDPALAPAFAATVGVVVQTEQKFAAIGKQTGTGAQKLADATTILGPALQYMFGLAGKANDDATIQKYINSVVGFLNAFPAGEVTSTVATPAPATTA